MFNPSLTPLQFLLLAVALLAAVAGFWFRACLLPWLWRRFLSRSHRFGIHPYARARRASAGQAPRSDDSQR